MVLVNKIINNAINSVISFGDLFTFKEKKNLISNEMANYKARYLL